MKYMPTRVADLMDAYDAGYSMVTFAILRKGVPFTRSTKYLPIIGLKTILYFNAVGNQVLVKKQYIEAAGFFDESLKRAQAYDMWTRVIELYGPVRMIYKLTQLIHIEHGVGFNATNKNNARGLWLYYRTQAFDG